MKKRSEYARAGVDYKAIEPFKEAMMAVGKRTSLFPRSRGVFLDTRAIHSHGAVFTYAGRKPHWWCKTQEGLGNKNWIAEWMYQFAGTGKTYYYGIGIDCTYGSERPNRSGRYARCLHRRGGGWR